MASDYDLPQGVLEGTIAALVARPMQARPGGCALHAPGRAPLSYRELYDQILETGQTLRRGGLRQNDRVALVLDNGPEAAAAFVAVGCAATCAPLNPAYRREEFAYYLQDLKAKALIVARGVETPAVAVAREQGLGVWELSAKGPAGRFALALEGATSPTASSLDLARP
jgi:acyl-CoA synthetase (AMP-forming)/AMP-acid ligase II